MTNLWIAGMKAPVLHIKGITSGTHCAPEQLRLPFHTSKGCQGTVHDMCLQDIVQLRWRPPGTGCSQPIGFVCKTQLILHVLPNPLCQLSSCGQPAQGRVGRPVYVLQPRWTGFFSVWHRQGACRILQKIYPAWFEKVEVKAYTTSRILRVGVHTTRISEYIRVYTGILQYEQSTSLYVKGGQSPLVAT